MSHWRICTVPRIRKPLTDYSGFQLRVQERGALHTHSEKAVNGRLLTRGTVQMRHGSI
jgi:hypothetical protein